jgi:transposase
MYYTGIDLHKKTSFLTTIDNTGTIVKRKNLFNDPKIILRYFEELDNQTRIVIESTASWYWIYDLLNDKGHHVVMSNPLKTKAIASAKIKNDKIDSHMLAQLLRADLVATVHVSSLEIRKLKELVRHRMRLVNDVTRIKNRIHTVLTKNNIQVRFSDLFGIEGIKYLQQIQLPDYHQSQLNSYLTVYEHLKAQIDPLTDIIKAAAKENAMAQLLMTIPGIGPILAMYIVAETGDITRFPSYRHFASYAGIIPSLAASAGKTKKGHITKQGSKYLRTAFIEAAHTIPRIKKSRLNVFFRKKIVRMGYRKAIVATAHKLLQIAFYVLKNQTPYQEAYPKCA